MKITQKCGPCGGEITIEHDSNPIMVHDTVTAWQRDHRCLADDERGRTGTGFAATSTVPTTWRDLHRQVVAREETPTT